MTRKILAAAAAVTVAASLHAQGQAAFSADRFRAHVAFLADDLLEGREAGTRGHEIAARYVATQFELLGMKPGAAGGSYFQPVNLREVAHTGRAPTLTIKTPEGRHRLRHTVDALIGGAPDGGTARVNGQTVFVGYGVTDPVLGIDDYAGLDVRGKVVVALAAPAPGIDSEIAAHLMSVQRRTAARHGAVGFIGIQTRAAEKARPFDALMRLADGPATSWERADGQPGDGSGMKAGALVGPRAAPRLFEGAPRTLNDVLDEADRAGARPAGFALKSTVELSVTTAVRRYASPDVVGLIEGTDPVLRNEYVVLMAHADHIGVNRSGSGDRINNGALDNAAGIATLLEVARTFATSTQRPRRSILLVANTAEEKGLLGAEAFANNPPVPIERIVAAVDLDMPLLLYDFTDVVAYGGSHSTLDRAFRAAGAEMGITLSPDPMPEQTIFVRSDHYAMAKAGVPAVMLATGMANGGDKAWASFLSTQYHQPSDDLTLPIHWNAGAKFAELNYRAIRILADSQEPARWYEGDYFGRVFAPKAAKAPRP